MAKGGMGWIHQSGDGGGVFEMNKTQNRITEKLFPGVEVGRSQPEIGFRWLSLWVGFWGEGRLMSSRPKVC